MDQPSDTWRPQVEYSSLETDIYSSWDTDNQSSQEADSQQTDSQSSEEADSQVADSQPSEEADSQEADRQSYEMEVSPEDHATQAISVPLPQNTPVTRRISRSLDNIKTVKTFFYKEQLGSENRTMEFKSGIGEFKGTYTKDVRRYASAFLNNGGGKLLFGVDDSGQVLGNNISYKQQDQYVVRTDDILKNFKPPVLPHNYTVDFIQVLRGSKDNPADFKDLKVLCLTFTPPTPCRRLYQTGEGKVFMRRNGSVEDMNPTAIHEWYTQMWTDEVEQKSRQLKQLTKENDELRRKQQSPQNGHKRKITQPALEEAEKRKSPRLKSIGGGGNNSRMEVPVLKYEDGEDEDLKADDEGQESQHKRAPPKLRSSVNTVTPMEKKRVSADKRKRMASGD